MFRPEKELKINAVTEYNNKPREVRRYNPLQRYALQG